jgi:glycosyltransferase involved in cell wall biosynthesis
VGTFHGEGVRAEELRLAGVPVIEFPVRSLMRPSVVAPAFGFLRWLRQQRIAIVHPFDYPTTLFAVPLARLAGVPVVLAGQRGERRLFPPIHQKALRLTDRLVHGVVANSEFIRELLVHDYGVPAARVSVCHNGLDTARFHASGRQRMAAVGAASCVLGCIAVQRPEKMLHTLIEAFAALCRHHPGLRLVLVGEGECRPQLEAQVRQANLTGSVLFEPSTNDVERWYRSIDLFVLPSSSEAFSNSLLEAMACGCCVAASRVGGNVEAVEDGETGVLFPAGDVAGLTAALDELLRDPTRQERLAAAGARKVAATYSLEAAAKQLGEVYRSFLPSQL